MYRIEHEAVCGRLPVTRGRSDAAAKESSGRVGIADGGSCIRLRVMDRHEQIIEEGTYRRVDEGGALLDRNTAKPGEYGCTTAEYRKACRVH